MLQLRLNDHKWSLLTLEIYNDIPCNGKNIFTELQLCATPRDRIPYNSFVPIACVISIPYKLSEGQGQSQAGELALRYQI